MISSTIPNILHSTAQTLPRVLTFTCLSFSIDDVIVGGTYEPSEEMEVLEDVRKTILENAIQFEPSLKVKFICDWKLIWSKWLMKLIKIAACYLIVFFQWPKISERNFMSKRFSNLVEEEEIRMHLNRAEETLPFLVLTWQNIGYLLKKSCLRQE